MIGMTVQVTFSDGNTSTAIWAHTGAAGSGTGAASGGDATHNWSLSQAGNTYTPSNATGFFNLVNNNTAAGNPLITDIILDGSVGVNANCAAGTDASLTCNTIFDRLSNPDTSTGPNSNEQTPNSHKGFDWQIDGGNANGAYNITVTYSKEFRLLWTNTCYNTGAAIPENTTAPCGDTWQRVEALFTGGTGVAKGTPLHFATDTDSTISAPELSTFALFGAGLLCIVVSVRSRNRIARN